MNFAAETSLGAVAVRAFDMVDRFFGKFVDLIDLDAKLFFHLNAVLEWLVLRIEALQYVTLCTAAVFLILLPKGTVTTGTEASSLKSFFHLGIFGRFFGENIMCVCSRCRACGTLSFVCTLVDKYAGLSDPVLLQLIEQHSFRRADQTVHAHSI